MATETPTLPLPIPPVDQEGDIQERRIGDVGGARTLWTQLREADFESNRQMARHQAMADGEPPYDQAARRASGQAYLSNFNPNDFKALLDTSLSAYTDLISANESFIDIFTTYGNESERVQWSQIMSRNMSRAIRSWPSFMYRYAYIPHYFTLHGVGIGYFEDCYNWQWEVTNLGQMKLPRDVKACEDEIEYCMIKSQMSASNLMRYVRKEEYAKAEGWNIGAIKRAMMQIRQQGVDQYNWMAWEEQWKNNDLVQGQTNPTVPVIYGWVKELDGSISVIVFPENSPTDNTGKPEEFMCYKRKAYRSAQEAFVMFTRGIGTNGTYHSIRGMAADIYNAMQALMRLTNRQMDLAFAAGPVFQVEDEEKIENAMLSPWGPFMLATSGIQVMSGIVAPNLNSTIAPAVDALRRTIQGNVGQYTSANALDSTREMSARETTARLEQTAQLSVTSINLFNQSMDRLAREIARRFTRKGYQRAEPGGHYVNDWIQDCLADGVPEQALHAIDHRRTRASRVIGFGSPAARRVALQSMMELWPMMDEYGKAMLLNNLTAAVVGWEQAAVYVPPPEASARPPVDAAIAELQNSVLVGGGTAVIQPNENKRVHLEIHIARMGDFIGMFEEAGQNPEMYAEIVPPLDALYEHAAATLEGYTGPDAPQFRQSLQQAGEILVNGTRHLQKEQARQAEMGEGQPQEGQLDPQAQEMAIEQQKATFEMQRRVIEWQVRLEQSQAEAEAKRQQKALDAMQTRQIKDADAAAKILRETAAMQARLATQQS